VAFRKAKRAAAEAQSARGPLEIVRLPGANDFDFTLTPLELQASRLARRFGLSAAVAAAIAVHAFNNGHGRAA